VGPFFFDISQREGVFEVSARTMLVGSDILVVPTGGRSHIGAVSIAQPRPGIKDAKKISPPALSLPVWVTKKMWWPNRCQRNFRKN